MRYQPSTDLLDGRVVLVTGAGDGIGKASALAYAHHGAHVILLGRTRQKLEAVFDQIEDETSTRPVVVPADLEHLDEAACDALLKAIEDEFGRLDGLLHNASILGLRVPVMHYAPDEWQRVMQVNVAATTLLTIKMLPLLDLADDASIILTSSGVGRTGRAYWGAYAVSKFAIEGFSQVLADEHEAAGHLRVNTINPGGTRTTMRAQAYPQEDPNTLPTPEDHQPLYLYLMGPDSRGVTGRQFDARSWAGPEDPGRE